MKTDQLRLSCLRNRKKNNLKKLEVPALTNVAQLIGCRPVKQKVTSSIPGQGTCLGCRFSPQLGHVKRQQNYVSLLHQWFSPSLSPFLPPL